MLASYRNQSIDLQSNWAGFYMRAILTFNVLNITFILLVWPMYKRFVKITPFFITLMSKSISNDQSLCLEVKIRILTLL